MATDLSDDSNLSFDTRSIGKPKLDVNITLSGTAGSRHGDDLSSFSCRRLSRKLPALG